MKKIIIFLSIFILVLAVSCAKSNPEQGDAGLSGIKIDFSEVFINVSALTVTLPENSYNGEMTAGPTKYADEDECIEPDGSRLPPEEFLMGRLVLMPENELENQYNMDPSCFDEYSVCKSSSNLNASMYMIIKPKAGMEAEAAEQIDFFLDKYYSQWSGYSQIQADMISRALRKNIGDYIIVIASVDNNRVFDEIYKLY